MAGSVDEWRGRVDLAILKGGEIEGGVGGGGGGGARQKTTRTNYAVLLEA